MCSKAAVGTVPGSISSMGVGMFFGERSLIQDETRSVVRADQYEKQNMQNRCINGERATKQLDLGGEGRLGQALGCSTPFQGLSAFTGTS